MPHSSAKHQTSFWSFNGCTVVFLFQFKVSKVRESSMRSTIHNKRFVRVCSAHSSEASERDDDDGAGAKQNTEILPVFPTVPGRVRAWRYQKKPNRANNAFIVALFCIIWRFLRARVQTIIDKRKILPVETVSAIVWRRNQFYEKILSV